MAGEGVKGPGVESTLFQLLENSGAREMDQGNLLILLSLVNLMGIINIINNRLGAEKGAEDGMEGISPEGSPESAPRGKGLPFDPSPLLAMLAGKDGGTVGPGQLVNLLSRFMGTPEGQPRGPVSGDAGADKAPAANMGDKKPGEEPADKTGRK